MKKKAPQVGDAKAEELRRARAARVVKKARLPLWRHHVDRALRLLDSGMDVELAVDALSQETKEKV